MMAGSLVGVWEELGSVPVSVDGVIEESFKHFEEGSALDDVWHWVEDTFDVSVHELLYSDRKEDKRMEKKFVTMKDIVGVAPGEVALRCEKCGRLFGMGDLKPLGTEAQRLVPMLAGHCPLCYGKCFPIGKPEGWE